jgi:hypothetical protein
MRTFLRLAWRICSAGHLGLSAFDEDYPMPLPDADDRVTVDVPRPAKGAPLGAMPHPVQHVLDLLMLHPEIRFPLPHFSQSHPVQHVLVRVPRDHRQAGDPARVCLSLEEESSRYFVGVAFSIFQKT